jgi:predicted RND superfamily exporter protein
MHDLLRKNLLASWARLCCDHPLWVLSISVALAVVSIVYTQQRLTFNPDRNDLISEDLPWNRRYVEYRKQFAGEDRIVVVVAVPAGPHGSERARLFIDRLAEKLAAEKGFVREATKGFQASPILLRMAPMELFEPNLARLAEAGPMIQPKNTGELLASLTAMMSQQDKKPAAPPAEKTAPIPPQSKGGESAEETAKRTAGPEIDAALADIDRLRRVIAGIGEVLGGGDAAKAFDPQALLGESDFQYLTTTDGKLMFIDIQPVLAVGNVDLYSPSINRIREIVKAVHADFPEIDAGLTGVPVLEADETAISLRDSEVSAVISAILIAILLLVAYHGWQLPLMAVFSLGVGVCWAFGFLTLAVGHLQVLSVVFTTILLGLGIDYGIHLMSRFELIRHNYPDDKPGFTAAMVDTMQTVGPGMLTGAITMAIAFSTTMLTDFRGMAEMGLIASVGVMLCLVAMWSVLPAVMRLFWWHSHKVTQPEDRTVNLHSMDYLRPMTRAPIVTVAVAAVVVAFGAAGAIHVQFDNNLLNMMPRELEALRWQDEIARHERAIWSAVSITGDLDEARRRTKQFAALPSVASVGGIGWLAPENEPRKLREIARVRAGFGDALATPASPDTAETPEEMRSRLNSLGLALGFAMNRKEVQETPTIKAALASVGQAIQKTLAVMSAPEFTAEAPQRMAALQRGFAGLRNTIAAQVGSALDPRPLRVDDLPEYLKRESVSFTKPVVYQVQVFPRDNVWDPVKLDPFIAEVRGVDPLISGSPVQIFESGRLMQQSYRFAGVLAILVVLVLAYFDFQNVAKSSLGMVVLVAAMVGVGFGGWWLLSHERWLALLGGFGGLLVLMLLIDLRGMVDTLLCVLPVTLGFVTTFGVMDLAGVSINPANLMVLPLLFGMGVAQGVNIVARYRQDPVTRPLGLSGGTGKAIPLTSATTIFAFAAMLAAEHRGIRSLGFVLTIGITLTLVACMTVMPAVLELRSRFHDRKRAATPQPAPL